MDGKAYELPQIAVPGGPIITYRGVSCDVWTYLTHYQFKTRLLARDPATRKRVERHDILYLELAGRHSQSDVNLIPHPVTDDFQFACDVARQGSITGVRHEVVSVTLTYATWIDVTLLPGTPAHEPEVELGADVVMALSDSYIMDGVMCYPHLFQDWLPRLTAFGLLAHSSDATAYVQWYKQVSPAHGGLPIHTDDWFVAKLGVCAEFLDGSPV